MLRTKAVVVLMAAMLASSKGGIRRIAEEATKTQKQLQNIVEENALIPATGHGREYDTRITFIPHKNIPTIKFEEYSYPEYSFLVRMAMNFIGNTSLTPSVMSQAKKYRKLQDEVPNSVKFPCQPKIRRSPERPTRADRVRPGDIDIIGTMGDSIIAGQGLVGTIFQHVLITNRGLSATGGGQGNWRKYLTLPNIIKELNPNLTGYATGDNYFSEQHQFVNLNLAEAAAVIDDAYFMAQRFVQKVRANPKMDLANDWKLVTIFMGNVDICMDFCFWKNPREMPKYVTKKLEETIDYLMENSPRTIVMVIITPHIPRFLRSNSGLTDYCKLVRWFSCSCVFGDQFQTVQDQYNQLVDELQSAELELINNPKYKSKDDFRVIPSVILQNLTIPKSKSGRKTDTKYLSADCYHLSQRAHALVARGLWNSLISQDTREMDWNNKISSGFKCPTDAYPYIAV